MIYYYELAIYQGVSFNFSLVYSFTGYDKLIFAKYNLDFTSRQNPPYYLFSLKSISNMEFLIFKKTDGNFQ